MSWSTKDQFNSYWHKRGTCIQSWIKISQMDNQKKENAEIEAIATELEKTDNTLEKEDINNIFVECRKITLLHDGKLIFLEVIIFEIIEHSGT